jgi:molybdenum cofactor cytidylyltransferase
MGSPKQLLRLDGESLMRRVLQTVLASRCATPFVVLGAHADAVAREIQDLPFTRVDNPCWREGIGSSIRVGVDAVCALEPPADAVLIVLADQPGVTAALLDRLVAAAATAPEGLVACEYAGTVGVPALYTRQHFDELRKLAGDRGGKKLLAAYGDAVVRIPFPAAATDLDTRADYARALKRADGD